MVNILEFQILVMTVVVLVVLVVVAVMKVARSSFGVKYLYVYKNKEY